MLVTNVKALPVFRGTVRGRPVAQVLVHGLFYGAEECRHLVGFALGDQFDGAVRQVANFAGHRVLAGQVKGGGAEADTLDPARVDYPLADDHGSPWFTPPRLAASFSERVR